MVIFELLVFVKETQGFGSWLCFHHQIKILEHTGLDPLGGSTLCPRTAIELALTRKENISASFAV
jgi:hypothetical protein